jgi:hypothetical protein
MRNILFLLLTPIFITACNNGKESDPNGIVLLGDLDMEDIYLDYRLTANEGDDNLNIVLQFREYDEEGRTLLIGEDGRVLLDGRELQADSAEMSGAYYEIQVPIETFAGDHEITLEGPGKSIIEKFHFQPMTLAEALPDTIRRQEGWTLHLEGTDDGDPVRTLMVDTSFFSDEINRVDTVRNGVLRIRPADLEQLNPGPIQLELYRELEGPIQEETRAGGRFSRSFSLRRSFILAD